MSIKGATDLEHSRCEVDGADSSTPVAFPGIRVAKECFCQVLAIIGSRYAGVHQFDHYREGEQCLKWPS